MIERKINIAVFASGSGTNANAIIKYFNYDEEAVARVSLVVCSHPGAGVITIAQQHNVPCLLISKKELYESKKLLEELETRNIDFIALAGFIWYVPEYIIEKYRDRIVNIHPALLPKYGGKGMFGIRVHEAVLANKEKESGLTIHFVNEEYDAGKIIFQIKCPVFEDDTPETLQNRIKKFENYYYPRIIERTIIETFF